MSEVTVYLAVGRTLDQKRRLVKEITEAMVRCAGAQTPSVVVTIIETPLENKAKGGELFLDRRARPNAPTPGT